MRHAERALLVMMIACAAVLPRPATAATIEGIGVKSARAVSDDGTTVVGDQPGAPGTLNRPFRWRRDTGPVFFDGIGFAHDVSADGAVVVGFGQPTGGNFGTYRWTPQTGMAVVRPGSAPFPNAISADGTTIASTSSEGGGGQFAFRWTAGGGNVSLSGPAGILHSYALAISEDGSVIAGGYETSLGRTQAYRWTQSSGIVGVGILPGRTISYSADIAGDGSVIVGYSESGGGSSAEAFRWTASTGMVGLGRLIGDDRSGATAVSDTGLVIGVSFSSSNPGVSRDFIWDAAQGIRPLDVALTAEFGIDLAGWTNLQATDITADGTVLVGNGINPSGSLEGWIVVIPEPAASWIAVVLGGSLYHRRRRSRESVRDFC
jgi:probable HAF family extracellular repeat protein